jgi:ribosomal protein S18 acetylase RimI-like enzyme
LSTPVPTIRPATVADLPELTRLLSMLNREEGYDISASEADLRAALFGGAAKVPMRALIAGHEKAVGLVLYYWGYDTVSASHGYHLADIIVEPAQRGQGVGRALFSALAAQCLGEDGQWVSLTVLKKNDRARQFYKALGMVEISIDFFAIGPQGLARCC